MWTRFEIFWPFKTWDFVTVDQLLEKIQTLLFVRFWRICLYFVRIIIEAVEIFLLKLKISIIISKVVDFARFLVLILDANMKKKYYSKMWLVILISNTDFLAVFLTAASLLKCCLQITLLICLFGDSKKNRSKLKMEQFFS